MANPSVVINSVTYASCPFSDDVLPIVTPTAIRNILITSSDQPCYDLHGRRINTMSQSNKRSGSTSNHGVMIRNGKKYLSY